MGAGYIKLVKGGLRDIDPAEKEAWAALQGVFSRLSQDYIHFFSGDPGVGAAYEALHRLHVMLVQEHSWDNVRARFGVPGDKGCLISLAAALSPEEGPNAVHPRLRAPLQVALKDFFLRLVINPVVRDTGDAAQVLAALDPGVFRSTSALFFGAYLAESMRQEERGLSRLARHRLAQFAEAKANQVVASFEDKFKGKAWNEIRQVGFTHLFRIMQGEPQWLAEQLRRNLRSEGPVSSAA